MDEAESPSPVDAIAPEMVPTDAAGWRRRLSQIPPRDLLRVVQEDPVRASQILSGFRATAQMLRHPLVAQRLADEALRQPKFARDLAALAFSAAPPPPDDKNGPEARPNAAPPAPSAGSTTAHADDTRLKEKLKEQRQALREKDERIAVLEAALSRSHGEQTAARAATAAAVVEQKKAEAQLDRLRRQQERDARRVGQPTVPPFPPKELAKTAPAFFEISEADTPPTLTPWEEALQRLLRRDKQDTVADVCREALASGGANDPVLHALYAQALDKQGHVDRAREQHRLAVDGHLDRGDVAKAAEAFTPLLSHKPESSDVALLRRLLLLARRRNQEDVVRARFQRVRASANQAYRRLTEAIASFGGEFSALLQQPPRKAVGPNETIALPVGGISAVSPRRLAAAVEANDDAFVSRAREGIRALRTADEPLAQALLDAVAGENPRALVPLTRETRAVVVDASNVARHDPDPFVLTRRPRVAHLVRVRDALLGRGFFPIVMLADASLRFHVDDRDAYAALIERGVIRETLPGTIADAALIAEARERGAPLVTNDRLEEWDEAQTVERIGFGIFGNDVSLALF